ncbi:MAG: transglutaminase domain-containing protein [Methanobacterium sp.]
MLLLFSLAVFINAEDVSAASTTTVDANSIIKSADTVKNYVETKKTVPNTVTVGSKTVTKEQYLYLLSSTTTNLNKNSKTSVTVKTVSKAPNPTENVKTGTLTKSEYVKLSGKITTFVNTYGRLPNFITTSKGKMNPDNLIYTYAKITAFYKTNNRLSNTVSVAPWIKNEGTSSTTTTAAKPAPSGTSFTIPQIVTAAKNYRNYVDSNYKTPSTVTVNGVKVNTPQFLQLLSYAIANLNAESKASITLKTVTAPANPTETVKAGTLQLSEFVKLAQSVKSTIASTGKAPNYVTSSLGNMRYETLTYNFAKVIQFYGEKARLPNTLDVVPYSSLNSAVTGNVQAIIDKIGYDEAKYGTIQGNKYSYLDVFLAEGKGNCWGSALYLYWRLSASGIQARIMGYIGGIANNSFKHAWTQVLINGVWTNWNYAKYSSKHCGDVGGGQKVVLVDQNEGKGLSTSALTNLLIKEYYAVL